MDTRTRDRNKITKSGLQSGKIPHYRLYQNWAERPEYEVNIPSHARPEDLCNTTLPFLRDHGVNMTRVNIFVDIAWTDHRGVDAMTLYSQCLRSRGFHEVHVRRGAAGLEGNMQQAWAFFDIGTYVITMSDRVNNVLEFVRGTGQHGRKRPLAKGSLLAVWHHAYDLMTSGGFAAWSSNASHSAMCMHERRLSRKAGLLDGNMTGQIVTSAIRHLQVSHGLIYDVEYAARLWCAGLRFVRYEMLCCKHTYRSAGGQSTLYPNPEVRRAAEDAAIRSVAQDCPGVLTWRSKPRATLRVMQYTFKTLGPQPWMLMKRSGSGQGRPLEYFASRPATHAERQAKMRLRKRKSKTIIGNIKKRPACCATTGL